MNLLDKAIASISPQAGLKRAFARQNLQAFEKRSYDGAFQGRRTQNLLGNATSANNEIGRGMSKLRDRARDLSRNTPHGARMLDVLTAHVVGTGIVSSADTGGDKLDTTLNQLYADWRGTADIEGVHVAGSDDAIMTRSMIEGGDCAMRFINLKPSEMGERPVPLAFQLMEGDQIDESRDGKVDDNRTRLGVRLGPLGQRVGYYLHKNHPSEYVAGDSLRSNFIPASEIIHMFRPLRIGQMRGVTWFAPILLTNRDFADLMEAMIVKTRNEASTSMFVIKEEEARMNIAGASGDDEIKRVEELRAGMVEYLKAGEDIKFAPLSGVGQFEQVAIANLQAMAAGIGLTYDQVSGDLRQANYSSLQAGKIEFRALVKQIQHHVVIPQKSQPMWRKFCDQVQIAGLIKTGEPIHRMVKHRVPAVEPIDPIKDLKADILAVRSGAISPQKFVESHGADWRDVMREFKQFFEASDADELVFDIDPRRGQMPGDGSGNGTEANSTNINQ